MLGGCGELPDIYQIVGLTADDATYWECPKCGMSEVVKGTPMNFGEIVMNKDLIKGNGQDQEGV